MRLYKTIGITPIRIINPIMFRIQLLAFKNNGVILKETIITITNTVNLIIIFSITLYIF